MNNKSECEAPNDQTVSSTQPAKDTIHGMNLTPSPFALTTFSSLTKYWKAKRLINYNKILNSTHTHRHTPFARQRLLHPLSFRFFSCVSFFFFSQRLPGRWHSGAAAERKDNHDPAMRITLLRLGRWRNNNSVFRCLNIAGLSLCLWVPVNRE